MMDEKQRKAVIEKIRVLSTQDKEFCAELRKMFGGASAAVPVSTNIDDTRLDEMGSDIKKIRELLCIQAECSLKYSFVDRERLRRQLIMDNLRMENAALDLKTEETLRFYNFCVNAFYQIENVINYYYCITFPKIIDLQKDIETYTQCDKYNFKSGENIKSVADITINYKLNAFCNKFFRQEKIKYDYINLRKVRNEGAHRCSVIIQDDDESDKFLYDFLKDHTINDVRVILIRLVNEVEKRMK